MDRQQLDSGDAKPDQIVDDRRRGEPREGAALALANRRMTDREAAHMHFEDDRLFPGIARVAVIVPGEGAIGHPAFRHVAGAVAAIDGEILARAAEAISEQHIAPAQLAGNRPRIGVEQQLVGVEPVAGSGVVGAVHPVAVELAGARLGQITVPHLVGVFRERDAGLFVLPRAVEQAQLHFVGVRREQRKIDPLPIPGRAERIGLARPHLR